MAPDEALNKTVDEALDAALNKGLVAAAVSRSTRWFRVITCRALMRLAHGSSTLYFTDFNNMVYQHPSSS
jgi:hypothetical protein